MPIRKGELENNFCDFGFGFGWDHEIGGGVSPYEAYTLALDFKNGIYRSPSGLVSNVASLPGYTYTRSGAKSEVANAGGIYPFAANVPGIVPGDGYWSRASLTNLLIRSQEFDNASWIKVNGAVSANATPAPDGSTTADRFVPTTTSGSHNVYQGGALAAPGVISVFAKANGYSKVMLYENGTNKGYGFDLAAGTTFVVGGIPAADEATITSVGNGWYRCSIRIASGSFTVPDIYVLNSTTYGNFAGDGISGVYFWQAQLVAGTQPGPIIVTAGATATVAADYLVTNYTAADEDQIFIATVTATSESIIAGKMLFTLHDGTTGNRLVLYLNSGVPQLYIAVGGGLILDVTLGTAVSAGRLTLLARRRGGKYTLATKRSSGAVAVGAESGALTFPPNGKITPGAREGGSQQINAPVEFIGIRRGTFSDADITAILQAA